MHRFRVVFAWLVGLVAVSACGAGDAGEQTGEWSDGLRKGQPGAANGDQDYCGDPANPCTLGEGDCDGNAQCAAGLVCTTGAGPRFALGTVEVCVPPSCANRVWDANECFVDCGGTSACGPCIGAPLTKSCGATAGSPGYCRNPNQRCGVGEGDCNGDAECQPGLQCKAGAGPQFGFSAGTDVCLSATCNNRVWDANECGVDCGGTSGCNACTTLIESKTCGGTNGGSNYCRNPNQRCGVGEGDCDSDAECAPGLQCKVGAGARFGFSAGTDVCLSGTCNNGVWDANECGLDCGGTSGCGPCATVIASKTCGGTNGGGGYCRNPNQKCAAREGD